MSLEISKIEDKNLQAAAMSADSKENGGDGDKNISSKELTVFMKEAMAQNCSNEDILQIANEVNAADEIDAKAKMNTGLEQYMRDLDIAVEYKGLEKSDINQKIEKTKNDDVGNALKAIGLTMATVLAIPLDMFITGAVGKLLLKAKLPTPAAKTLSVITGTAALIFIAGQAMKFPLDVEDKRDKSKQYKEQARNIDKETEALKKEQERVQKLTEAA